MRFWPSSKGWDHDEGRCSCNAGHARRRAPVMRVASASTSAFASLGRLGEQYGYFLPDA